MKRLGIDLHAVLGAGGFLGTITLTTVNEAIACLVGLATLAYMSFKAAREYIKWRRDERKEENEA